ncbi:hypothetical protein OKA04_14140 [Luteolibacter flavescens]|uniref:Uncharacterized protein n=1 Tax=Luteolibacter flavescens TaxID=1859460 RepID=A0ABT3FQN1_9BACT|nr:hypothetical protein [Luteolibacter flavescens]MCW1885875.1 hypothetical protein [Luteolibacter flavescens]
MKACCQNSGPDVPVARASKPPARARRLAGWLVPGGLLLLVPKCPVCLAGYVAVFTGIGISLPVATWLRYGLIATCLAILATRFLLPALRAARQR